MTRINMQHVKAEAVLGQSEVGYAKGRNGYFALDHLTIDDDSITHRRVWLHAYSKQSTFPGPCYVVISKAEARELAEALLKAAADTRIVRPTRAPFTVEAGHAARTHSRASPE